MKTIKRHSVRLYLALALAGLAMLYLWPSLVAAMPLTAKQQLERAWRLAADVGSYAYRTDAVQTSYPTPRLDNAGRSPRVERIWAEGMVDRPHNALTMKLSLGAGQQPIELKVENGRAFGRAGTGDAWVEVDNPTDIFAPNGDPLGFLLAAENIQELGVRSQESGGKAGDTPNSQLLTPDSSRYTFDINGPKYADYMRQQLEAVLRERGELPAGLTLRTADQYAEMQAHGEIWLNEAGLPLRQTIHLSFPPERDAHNRIEADITTTFSRWDTASLEHQLFWAIPRLVDNPSLLVKNPLSLLPTPYFLLPASPENLQKFGVLIGLGLLLLALVIMTLTHGKSPKFYAAVAVAVIMMMLVTPLLQSNQTYAATERLRTRQAEQQQEITNTQAADQLKAEVTRSDFNPQVNPLTTSPPP